MRTSLIIVTMATLLLLAGPASALPDFKDTVENYPTGDYTDYWTYGSNVPYGSSGSVSVVQYPTEYPSAHALNIKVYCNRGGVSASSYLTTNQCIFDNYFSFTTREYSLFNYGDTSTYALLIQMVDESGTVGASYNAACTRGVYEIIENGNDVYLYINGEMIDHIDNGLYNEDTDYKIRIGSYISKSGTASSWASNSYTKIWIDDISTESCIGINPEWNEFQDTISCSYRIQGLSSYHGYDYTTTLTALTGDTLGLINTTTLDTADDTDAAGFVTWDRSEILGTNYGLYMISLLRDETVLDSDYFVYSQSVDPLSYPDILLSGTADVPAEIRDDDGNGGTISAGGSVYLYPTPADSGAYNITYEIEELPYSLEAGITKIFATSLNSTLIEFSGLSGQNYLIEIDGESVSGTKATGSLAIDGNVSDAETISIGSDVYEFNSTGSTTGDNIPVEMGTNVTTAAGNLTTAINNNGTAAVSANCTVSEIELSEGFTYIAECTITDPSDQDGFQTAFNISQQSGMQADGEDIRFMATNGTNLSYWIDYPESVNNSYYTGYVATPADATKIYLYYGNAEASDASNPSTVFESFFDGDSTGWTELDPNSHITFQNNRLEFSGISRNEDVYVYQQNSNVAGLDTTIEYTIYISSGDANAHIGVGDITSTIDDYTGTQYGYIYSHSITGTSVYIYNSGIFYGDAVASRGTGTAYYTRGVRVGDTVTIYVYSDAARSNLVSSSTQTQSFTDTGLQYLYLAQSRNTGHVLGISGWIDDFKVRKYAATEPTLSIGTPAEGASAGATIGLIADSYGTAGNSIATTETLINGSFASATLTGGTAGSQTDGADTWSYEITDWTNLSTHTFEFSPDMTLPGVWGYIKDSSTQEGITSATITIANGSSTSYLYTDGNGMYYKTSGMSIGTYNVSAAKSGYSDSIPMDVTCQAGLTTRQDFYLDAAVGEGVYYAPHYVSFYFYDDVISRTPLTHIPVYIYDADNVSISSDPSDDMGIVGAQLSQNVKYRIVATYGTTTQTEYIYPVGDSYDIYFDDDIDVSPEAQFENSVNITINKEKINATAAQIQVYYNDSSEGSTGLQFNLYADNGTLLNSSIEGDVNTASHNFTVFDYNGKSYIIQVSGTHADFGTFSKQYGITFGLDLKTDTFGAKAWLYFSVGFLIFVMLSFTSTKHTGIGMTIYMMTFSVFGVLGVFGTHWYLGSPLQIVAGLGWVYTIITIGGEKRRAVEG